jgi:glycosyltransferase involved in cell wall biosynthesis
VQNKVLEAMAAGRAVVTTSVVNQGIGAQAGRDLIVADTTKDISSAIVRLLRDDEARRCLGTSARSFVQQHFRWDLVRDRVEAILSLSKHHH